MGLMDVVERAKNATQSLGDVAEKQVKGYLSDFKKAADVLETLGFTIGKFSFTMGALPEVHTTLDGKIENIQEERLQKMIDEYKAEEILVASLRALLWVKWGWAHMELKKLSGVRLNVTLALPPRISAELC